MAMSRAPRVHPAWIVLGALTVCMLAGSGLRSVFGVYIKPMEAEFGWTRGALSGAAAVSLLLLGRSEEHTSELQSQSNLVCRLLLEKKTHTIHSPYTTIPKRFEWVRIQSMQRSEQIAL